MQPYTINTLGFKLGFNVPSTVEEFDQLAKRSGAALDEAIKNVIYRSVMNVFRDTFLHGRDEEKDEAGNVKVPAIKGLDEKTGIERKSKVTKPEARNEKGEITQEEVSSWDESEQKYFDRVMATLVQRGDYPSIEAAVLAFQTDAQAVLDTIVFDPEKQPRTAGGPKKTPKSYVEVAEALIELSGGNVEEAVRRFNAKTGRSVAANKDDLARGIWDDQKAKRKDIAAGYAG